MWTGETTQPFFQTLAFGVYWAVPFAFVASILAFGPAVALWIGLHRVFRCCGFTQRSAALLTAPIVAFTGSISCLMSIILLINKEETLDFNLLDIAVFFSIPGLLVAEIYAHLAWPLSVTSEGNRL